MLSILLLLAAQEVAPRPEYPALDPAVLRADLHLLASDSLRGRRTGEPGAQIAAEWIRSRYLRAGLQPFDGGWFQEFPAEPVHLDDEATFLRVGETRLAAGADYLPHPTSPEGVAAGDLVFVGYGLHAPARGYDDFAGVDLDGKVAVLFRWEPGFADGDSPLDGRRMLPQSSISAKVDACAARGAVGVLIATPPDEEFQKPRAVPQPYWPAPTAMWDFLQSPAIAQQMDAEELAATNFTIEDAVGQLFTMMQNTSPSGAGVPVGYVSPRVMRGFLRKAGVEAGEWVARNAESLQPESFALPLAVEFSVAFQPVDLVGRNVVGVLPGRDPELADEYVVVGAHYDHVGFNEAGEIWNGADDNGSGTVAMLGLADALAALPASERPRRSIVFVAFSGEELGLIGAYRFLADDALDPDQMAGMVNLDMIGRAAQHEVMVMGTKSAEGLRALVEGHGADQDPLVLRFDNEEFFDRSDQVAFYYEAVPIVFFNTEEHNDYHKPTDTPDKIEYEDLARIATVALRTVRSFADADERMPFVDGYGRLQPVYGQNANLPFAVFPVTWADRLDY